MSDRDEEFIDIMARAMAGTDNENAVSVSRAVAALIYDSLRESGYVVLPKEGSDAQIDAFFNQLKRMKPFGVVTREKVRRGYEAALAAHTNRSKS